jgi:hypothetical protein
VFPLLCPVREADWIDGWGPIAVWSKSGLVEPDCVFLTRSEPHESIWYVTCHEPERNHVEMLKITPGVTVPAHDRSAARGSRLARDRDACTRA